MSAGGRNRVILHVDMDAFYAAVEVRENPALAGRPVIVGHRGPRGVVSTCSYEARRFGVHSAMPSVKAERLCPGAVWLPGRMDLYARVSRRIRRILEESAPAVEPLSIDEAFLDLTGVVSGLEGGRETARLLKGRIRREEGLTASVGVAPNKFLAKVASDLEKPDGLVVFPSGDVPRRLWPMPVERLWGVGPRTAERLRLAGLRRIGDLARVEPRALASVVGATHAAHLQALARGEDDRPVEPDRLRKSISEERTYRYDLTDAGQMDRELLARADGVARDLRRKGLVGSTVHLKVRTGDFTTWTRSVTLPRPTELAEEIVQAARALLRERIDLRGKGVRLLGVGVSRLEPASLREHPLFPDPERERARRRARVLDAVREKLGEGSLIRARLLRRKKASGGEERQEPEEASSPPAVD